MLLWELLSGRRHKNKEKLRHNAEPVAGSTSVASSVAIPATPGLTNVCHQVQTERTGHHSPLGSSLSSPPSQHPPTPEANQLEPPPLRPAPLFRPSIPFNSRTPDSVKLFKNSVLSRRHSTSAGLNPGLLGPSTGASGVGGGTQRARRRRGEDAQRFSDRRRQHKYSVYTLKLFRFSLL